jgi:hypothetical protein
MASLIKFEVWFDVFGLTDEHKGGLPAQVLFKVL